VFIWISPGETPAIPAEWEQVLAARKLLFVGAFKAGNPRNIFDRIRLAVAANTGMRERFNVDARRVYVSGFSGGARVASMLGVAYADMFTGALPFMGVNFYEDVALGDGKTQGADFIPDAEVLAIAKKSCRYALVTGEKDFNRAGTKAVFEQGYRKEKFANVLYLEAPGIGHAMPPVTWLEHGLDFLDSGKGGNPAEAK
jgi:predicted esterase